MTATCVNALQACSGPSFGGYCAVFNFFETTGNATQCDAGRIVFGDVLEER